MFSIIKKVVGFGNTNTSANYEASSSRSVSSVVTNTYRYY